MSRRGVEIQEIDANRSDPEDVDYEDRAPRSSRKRKVVQSSSKPRSKRRRKTKRSDLGDDDEEVLGSSDEDLSFSGDSSIVSAEVEKTATGRPKRRAAHQSFKESSEEEEAVEEIESDTSVRPRRSRLAQRVSSSPETQQRSKVVVFPGFWDDETSMPQPQRRSARNQRASKSVEPTRALGTRRSSRHSAEGDLYELSTSGRHAKAVRKSSTPEAVSTRSLRAAKRPPTESAIIEASQEDSQEQPGPGGNDAMEEDQGGEPLGSGEEDENQLPTRLSVIPEDNSQAIAESVQSDVQGDVPEQGMEVEVEGDDDDDDDDQPIRTGRTLRAKQPVQPRQQTRSARRGKKSGDEDGSDFEPVDEEDDDGDVIMSGTESPRKDSQVSDGSSGERRSQRIAGRKRPRGGRSQDISGEESEDLDRDELAEEALDLQPRAKKRRRQRPDIAYDMPPTRRARGQKPDYRIFKPETLVPSDDEPAQPVVSRTRKSAGPYRSLLSTLGPFGGAGGPAPVLQGPEAAGAVGGADSDSSDDETPQRQGSRANVGGTVGMTPTSAAPQNLFPQTLNADPAQGGSGPSKLGKVSDKKTLADADPLGVDQNVNFEGVGGLDNHINQLKEMVALPLLYPEVFQQFKVTPPRGVLFHGPPGTGKTLLARALASSVSSQGRKVTFYMRKGADALSKWVGEAERQLRLLFEEARKNQPSIIFFDEIDGLAPVRSSKQEQIHASIVATLLALMDGMDGRGQVIVIGATNRPDSVDPALRRPGRFDREFFFPLPDKLGRRSIIDIHTKGWNPPLEPKFKNQLAELTKGYGGADLRALCTEAALNAVQGTYPQIYKSTEKLLIDPRKIRVQAKDFMISIDKMIPSSERSGSSNSTPLDHDVEPLLRRALDEISNRLDDVLPNRPKRTALEEAEYDDRDDVHGFDKEMMQQNFDRSRVYRPRLLIQGLRGMGQQYIGGAILHKYERLHVQNFDLANLYSDATRTPEAAIVQLFNEVRRHKPGVIYIPNVNVWYETVGPSVTKLFSNLLRSLPPTEPVLVLGVMEVESEDDEPNRNMLRDLFGYSENNRYTLSQPSEQQRREYFTKIVTMIDTPPTALPEAGQRKKRQLSQLDLAPAPPQAPGPSKAELKAQKKQDMHTLNMLKISIQPIMDQLKNKYKKFRHPAIDESRIGYLYDEQNPNMLSTDLPEEVRQQQEQLRPFELRNDPKGVPGLYETATGKFFYNLEITTIERRLSNGYYKRYKDFLADIKRMCRDAHNSDDFEKATKANEILSNVEVDIHILETQNPALHQASEEVYAREKERENLAKGKNAQQGDVPRLADVPPKVSETTTQTTGPITLGEAVPTAAVPTITPQRPASSREVLTNGDSSNSPSRHHTSNGDFAAEGEQDLDDNVAMGNSQPNTQFNTQPTSQNPRRSQKSAMTPLAHNSQPGDYHNSASTTTTSERNRSDKTNTQSSNGIHREATSPDFSGLKHFSGQSQLPDTQEMAHSSSQSASQRRGSTEAVASGGNNINSQPMLPPPAPSRTSTAGPAALSNILNSEPAPTTPKLVIDHNYVKELHDQLTRRSSGCSVEQLEQIMARLMDAVWRTRGEWNRTFVCDAVQKAFNEGIRDVEHMQGIASGSLNGSGRSSGLEGGQTQED